MIRNDDLKSTTIGDQLRRAGIPRRDFLKFCTELMIVAPIGLAITKKAWAGEVAADLLKAQRPMRVLTYYQMESVDYITGESFSVALGNGDQMPVSVLTVTYFSPRSNAKRLTDSPAA